MAEQVQNPATDATPQIKRDPRANSILESLRNGESIVTACKAAGIHPATFWRWRKADSELDAETEAAISSRVMIVEDALYANALKGNVTAQMFYLMNQASERWKDKRAVPNVSASASAGAEAQSGSIDGARSRIKRDVRILKSLGLDLGLGSPDKSGSV